METFFYSKYKILAQGKTLALFYDKNQVINLNKFYGTPRVDK